MDIILDGRAPEPPRPAMPARLVDEMIPQGVGHEQTPADRHRARPDREVADRVPKGHPGTPGDLRLMEDCNLVTPADDVVDEAVGDRSEGPGHGDGL